ncbi:MAG: choice-of-anchor Q domain-containing protein [Candidatus Binataceae bacterium]
MRRKHQLFAVLVPACLMLALPAACRAATTITVNSNSDTSSMSNCVLRDAITAANTNANTGGCSVGMGGPFTIDFSSGLDGDTIMLAGTLPPIVNGVTLTIQGPTTSPGITINGNTAHQIMEVNSGATVSLQNLTLANGSELGASADPADNGEGGAIFNQGTLTVTNSTLSSNQANGGVGTQGGSGQGGAIFNSGTLTITNSTFSSNQATGGLSSMNPGSIGTGGAIYNSSGTLTVTNTTFSGNEATGGVGTPGQGGFGQGGAITIFAGTLTMTNATFSGNQAIAGGPGGGAASGGAIYNEGTVNLKGTILAASTPHPCGGTAAITASSSIVDADDSTCGFTNGTNGNAVVTNTSDIGLATGLANNGGPTETIALTPGGTANAFIATPCTDQSSNPLTTDQRGVSRPQPSHSTTCSAGAFEYNPPFFNGEASVGNQTYYLTFFGYYSYQFYPWLYHFGTGSVGLGFEYVFDANDGAAGVWLYDNGMQHFLYTNPSDFPIMYDNNLTHWLYYFPGTSRVFYDFTTGMYFNSPPG